MEVEGSLTLDSELSLSVHNMEIQIAPYWNSDQEETQMKVTFGYRGKKAQSLVWDGFDLVDEQDIVARAKRLDELRRRRERHVERQQRKQK